MLLFTRAKKKISATQRFQLYGKCFVKQIDEVKLADKCHENVFYGIILCRCTCNKCYCDKGNIILFSGKLDCFYTNNNDCFGVSHLLEGYLKRQQAFSKRGVYICFGWALSTSRVCIEKNHVLLPQYKIFFSSLWRSSSCLGMSNVIF